MTIFPRHRELFILFFVSLCASVSASTNLSAWVFPGASGRLIAQPDALGNRIIDESSVGYKQGLAPLPSTNIVPVKITVTAVVGDNVSNIQAAINYVSALRSTRTVFAARCC
jgi:hypothetical protein